jgi:hypothetical protein
MTLSLTEVLFVDALKRARELDDFFTEHGRLVGPLHGVPMTLKDQFDIQGYDSTLGYVGRAFKPAAEDCVLVAMLKQMGAVIIAKSNLPQSIMVRRSQFALATAVIPSLLCGSVVRNGEPSVGFDRSPKKSLLYPWWLYRWRGPAAFHAWIRCRMGNRHWWKCQNPSPHDGFVRLETKQYSSPISRRLCFYRRPRTCAFRCWAYVR